MKPIACLICDKVIGDEDFFSMAYIKRRPTTQIVLHDMYFHRECFFESLKSSESEKMLYLISEELLKK